jgi:hypothetical protein
MRVRVPPDPGVPQEGHRVGRNALSLAVGPGWWGWVILYGYRALDGVGTIPGTLNLRGRVV